MNFNVTGINSIRSAQSFKSIPSKSSGNSDKKGLQNSVSLERSPQKDNFQISIGYINDTHGQTNNMMRILSGFKGDLRLSAGDNDIGDEKNKPVHRVTYKFLKLAGIKSTALGNHELDPNQEDLIDSLKEFDGDVLALNIKKDDIDEQNSDDVKRLGRAKLDEHWKKSKIVEVKGEKIGLIGASPMDMLDRLTHPEYHTDCHVDSLENTIEEIQDAVSNFKNQGINKIILLSHLGHKNDRVVAQNTDGLDVIIGGHTHELINGITEGENLFYSKSGEPVLLTEAGRDGNYFGELNLTFDKEGIITKAQNNLGDTGLFHKNMINQYVFDDTLGKAEKVGYIQDAPPPPKSLIEENPHANFVCDIMREQTDSDIALWHLCGVRNFFHEGEIDSRDIKDISPFLDYVAVANVSEKTLVDLFKTTAETTFSSHGHKPGLFAVSGLKYSVNPNSGKLTNMTYIDKNGKEYKIDIEHPREDKMYKVVTDEFLMSAGADFNILAKEEEYIKKYPYDKDVMICDYIKEYRKPIVINQYGRLKLDKD